MFLCAAKKGVCIAFQKSLEMVPNTHTLLVAIADSNVELESGADAGVLKLRHFSTICITFAIKNATKAQNLVDLLQRQT